MGSISNRSPSEELLQICLRGEAWTNALLDRAIEEEDGRALLRVVVEALGDAFEPRLAEVYSRLFKQVVGRVAPELRGRLRSLPATTTAPSAVDRVYVLSRVTLGADVAATSVLIDAAKTRYPAAEIVFTGPRKSFEMFEADPRLKLREIAYARGGSLAERLRASADLWIDDGIVIDPDSRLTQLGLISVCEESRYFWFQSRSMAGGRLPEIAADWARASLGVEARAYIAPRPSMDAAPEITISLGVGENESKRLGDDFELELMKLIAATGRSVLVDKGGSAAEKLRVERALQPGMRTHDGAFAPFAAQIAKSNLYIGYDSAGGHVASTCGVPVISIFAGALNDRFVERWSPLGTVIRPERGDVLRAIQKALQSWAGGL